MEKITLTKPFKLQDGKEITELLFPAHADGCNGAGGGVSRPANAIAAATARRMRQRRIGEPRYSNARVLTSPTPQPLCGCPPSLSRLAREGGSR